MNLERLVALTRRQDLEPVECGPDTVPSEGNRLEGALAGESRVHSFDPALERRMPKDGTRPAAHNEKNPQHPHKEQNG